MKTHNTASPTIPYRPEIDGLRAIAVLSVLMFHAGAEGFSGGYVGVDVFFVISGFLITSMLLAESADGSLSLRRFYERRARRILPALLLVIAACLPAAWLWLPPRALTEFGASVGYACIFLANLFFYDHSTYFDGEIALKPLAHTWSLAVEEQFYLAFPLVLLVCLKLRRLSISVVLTMLAGASLLYAQALVELNPQAAFYLMPSRIWELLLGALLAIHRRDVPSPVGRPGMLWPLEFGSLAGISMIACAVLVYNQGTVFPGFAALLPTIGAALVIACAAPTTWTGRVLASPPLVFVGLISYSTYLWHQPLMTFLRHATKYEPGSVAFLLAGGLSLAAGYFSWRFVERPFRQPGRISTRTVITTLAVPTLVLSATGWSVVEHDGFETYYYAHRASDAEKRVRELQQKHSARNRGGDRHVDDGACRFHAKAIDDAFLRRFADCARQYGPAVVVLGDSHGVNIHNALSSTEFGGRFLIGLTQPGCRAENLGKSCPYADFARLARDQSASIGLVVYHQSGSYFIADRRGHVDSGAAFGSVDSYRLRMDYAEVVMRYLDDIAETVPTVWLGPFAEARVDLNKPVGRDALLAMNPASLQAFASLDAAFEEAVRARRQKWQYISLLRIVRMSDQFLVQGDCLTFQDVDHLSACGEALIASQLVKGLAASL